MARRQRSDLQSGYWIAGKLVDAAMVRAAVARLRDRRLREEIERFLEGTGPFPSQEALAALRERLLEVIMMQQRGA